MATHHTRRGVVSLALAVAVSLNCALIGTRAARACSCITRSLQWEYKHAAAVFTGTVLAIEREPLASQCDREGITRPRRPIAEPPAAERHQGTGCIAGRITHTQCEVPLPGVTVRVGTLATWTDSSGGFELCGLPPGMHRVDAGRRETERSETASVEADRDTQLALQVGESFEIAPYWERALVQVVTASKGVRAGRKVWVYTSLSSCRFAFEKGSRVRLYATRDEDGELGVGLCSRSKVLTSAPPARGPG